MNWDKASAITDMILLGVIITWAIRDRFQIYFREKP